MTDSNFKIGDYTISSEKYYDALKSGGLTDSNALKKIDQNGDKKLSARELQRLDSDKNYSFSEDELAEFRGDEIDDEDSAIKLASDNNSTSKASDKHGKGPHGHHGEDDGFDGPPPPPDGERPDGPPPGPPPEGFDGEGPMGPPPDGFDGDRPMGPPPDGFDGEPPEKPDGEDGNMPSMGRKPDKKPDSKPGGDKTPPEFLDDEE